MAIRLVLRMPGRYRCPWLCRILHIQSATIENSDLHHDAASKCSPPDRRFRWKQGIEHQSSIPERNFRMTAKPARRTFELTPCRPDEAAGLQSKRGLV